MLRVSMQWTWEIDSSLWHMAVDYVAFITTFLMIQIFLLMTSSLDIKSISANYVIYICGGVLNIFFVQSFNKERISLDEITSWSIFRYQ